KTTLTGEIAAAEAEITSLERSVAAKKTAAAAAAIATPPSTPEQQKASQAEIDAIEVTLVDKKNVRMVKKAQSEALDTKPPFRTEQRTLRRTLIRDKTKLFRADFLRQCDVKSGGCSERFDYVLLELSSADVSDLDKRFKDAR